MPASVRGLGAAALLFLLTAWAPPAFAQEPATRTEEIELARIRKRAELWPETEGALVQRANQLLDRGLLQGIRRGGGANGWQLVLNGTRSGQGQTFGIGYRRSDLFHEALDVRTTVRGTRHLALLVDVEANVNHLGRSGDTFVDVYGKYERSPRMEFYGLGRDSLETNRTGYLLNTGSGTTRAGYRFTERFNVGMEFGVGHVHTAPVTRDDVPSIETIFDATTAPGLFDDTTFVEWGGFAGFDSRDLPTGPKRGGFYGVRLSRYVDVSGGAYSHRFLEINGQHFFPYFNETRVLALFAKARFAYAGEDDGVVPFYLLPNLGGNFELRGFDQYRFHDNNAFVATVEHRWYGFRGLEMALFVDGGKTVSNKGQIDFSGLNYSGGIGFRGRVQDAIVLRVDLAGSREGVRVIFSLSDVSRRRF